MTTDKEDREALSRDYIRLEARVARLTEENARLALGLAAEHGEVRNLREENARLRGLHDAHCSMGCDLAAKGGK